LAIYLLISAASCEHMAVVRLLLSRGADVTLTDSDGTSVVDSTDNKDIIALLKASMSQPMLVS